MKLSLSGGTLAADGSPLLEGVDAAFALKGSFLSLPATGEAERHGHGPWRHIPLGRPARVAAYAGQAQRSPFWFTPAQGADPAALDAIAAPVSLYEPVCSEGGDALTVMDQVRDSKNTDEQWIESISLREAISRLSEREKRILSLRFYDGRTQMEVAGAIGISQAQVSRLEKSAIRSIRSAILPS